jgi:tryptophan-rich sensory protein
MKINWKALFASIAISLFIGGLAGFLTRNSMNLYQTLEKPPLSPPGWVFPVVWTILYILMGISAYIIYESEDPMREKALQTYSVQLVINFSWSIVFFLMNNYWLAFAILVILWFLILKMIVQFYQINKIAAVLQIPYLLWVTFAGYLNFMIALTNM